MLVQWSNRNLRWWNEVWPCGCEKPDDPAGEPGLVSADKGPLSCISFEEIDALLYLFPLNPIWYRQQTPWAGVSTGFLRDPKEDQGPGANFLGDLQLRVDPLLRNAMDDELAFDGSRGP